MATVSNFRSRAKKNVPKVDLQSYSILICGTFKTGKTRAWKEITELHYPTDPDAALLLAFEPGYVSWELDNFIPMHEYDWKFFRNEVVKGLLEEAKTGRITKVIGIDTVDRCIDMCTAWVLDEAFKKYGKKFETLQEISENVKGANGWTMLGDELKKQFDALKNAGYGFIWLAWTKEKETELIDGLKYNSLELMMNNTAKKVFNSQADLVCCLHNEVKVLDKEGNVLDDNLKDKKGKEKASNFHTTETYMYFRESNYIGIAGGRFTELPEKVPYSAENFMQVFEEAVKGQLKKTTKTVEELKEEEIVTREEKAKEYVESVEEVENETVEGIIAYIDEKAPTIMDQIKRKTLNEKLTELKANGKISKLNYKMLTDVGELKHVKALVDEILVS